MAHRSIDDRPEPRDIGRKTQGDPPNAVEGVASVMPPPVTGRRFDGVALPTSARDVTRGRS